MRSWRLNRRKLMSKNRTVSVTARVNKSESEMIREFCSQFDWNMADLLRELIFFAMDTAPIKNETPILVLEDRRIPFRDELRTLRGCRPATKKRSK